MPSCSRSDTDKMELPSVGSRLHGEGRCRPCAFFHGKHGCKSGQECLFCHRCSSRERSWRKHTVRRIRALARIAAKAGVNRQCASQAEGDPAMASTAMVHVENAGAPRPRKGSTWSRADVGKSLPGASALTPQQSILAPSGNNDIRKPSPAALATVHHAWTPRNLLPLPRAASETMMCTNSATIWTHPTFHEHQGMCTNNALIWTPPAFHVGSEGQSGTLPQAPPVGHCYMPLFEQNDPVHRMPAHAHSYFASHPCLTERECHSGQSTRGMIQ